MHNVYYLQYNIIVRAYFVEAYYNRVCDWWFGQLLHDTDQPREMLSTDQSPRTKAYWCHILAWNSTRNFQLGCRNFQFKLEISSWTKWKFPVRTRNFQLECRNFQFEEVEISSSNSKFPVGMSKFPVWRSRNFQFKLEISSSNYG